MKQRVIWGALALVASGLIVRATLSAQRPVIPTLAEDPQQQPLAPPIAPPAGGPGQFDPNHGPWRGGMMPRGDSPMGPRPQMGPDIQKIDILRNYIDTIEHFSQMSRSADSAGVSAVVSATDMLRQRSLGEAIDFLNQQLPEVKSPTIERAIRIQLADLYRQAGQTDKAIAQLSILIKVPG